MEYTRVFIEFAVTDHSSIYWSEGKVFSFSFFYKFDDSTFLVEPIFRSDVNLFDPQLILLVTFDNSQVSVTIN